MTKMETNKIYIDIRTRKNNNSDKQSISKIIEEKQQFDMIVVNSNLEFACHIEPNNPVSASRLEKAKALAPEDRSIDCLLAEIYTATGEEALAAAAKSRCN